MSHTPTAAGMTVWIALLFAGNVPCQAQVWGEPSAAEKKIAAALDSPVDVSFIEAPLSDVVELLAYPHGIEIRIDRRGLSHARFDPDTPVTRDFNGIRLRSALRLVLEQWDLGFAVVDGAVFVSTAEEAVCYGYVRLYTVDDLIARLRAAGWQEGEGDVLIDLVATVVDPLSHWGGGGVCWRGALAPGAPEVLVVWDNLQGHEEVANVLTLLRRAADLSSDRTRRPSDVRPIRIREPGESRIVAALDSPIEMQFADTPLDIAVELLRKQHGIEIQINYGKLADARIEPDVPLLHRGEMVPLRGALRRMLRRYYLAYVIRDEVLLITTLDDAWTRTSTVIYPLPRRSPDPREAGPNDVPFVEALKDTITATIEPSSWTSGPGTISALSIDQREVLVVRQTDEVHEQIAEFLQRPEFRRSQASPPSRGRGLLRRRLFPPRRATRR